MQVDTARYVAKYVHPSSDLTGVVTEMARALTANGYLHTVFVSELKKNDEKNKITATQMVDLVRGMKKMKSK